MRKFLFLMVVFLLSACGESVKSGTIISKWYEPEVDEYRYEYTCQPTFTDMTTECKMKFVHHYEQEQWKVKIESCVSGECKYGVHSITRETFDSHTEGDYISFE